MVIPSTLKQLESFINKHEHLMRLNGLGSSLFEGRTFSLSAKEFISYAEAELKEPLAIKSQVNCISNLKRALDCQIDRYLSVLGLHSYLKKKNIKVGRKIELLNGMGFIRLGSLEKLNTIRNRIEHHYNIPERLDLELYFDLISSFVEILETALFEPISAVFDIQDTDYSISTTYVFEHKRCEFCFWQKGKLLPNELHFNISDDFENFAEAYRLHRNLIRLSLTKC